MTRLELRARREHTFLDNCSFFVLRNEAVLERSDLLPTLTDTCLHLDLLDFSLSLSLERESIYWPLSNRDKRGQHLDFM